MNRFAAVLLIGTFCGCALCTLAVAAVGQARGKPPTAGGRNLITISMSKAWEYKLDDPAKLMEIGSVSDPHKNSLVLVLPGKDNQDTARKMLVTHWDGVHFAKDSSMDFRGLPIDALLIGKFRSARTAPVDRSPFDRPGATGRPSNNPVQPPFGASQPQRPVIAAKPGLSLPPTQIVTTEGVYAWKNKGMARLFGAPLDVRMAMVLADQDQDDKLVTGAGDTASCYYIGENYVRESTDGAPTSGAGYARFGAGVQDFAGAAKMILAPDVRYVQSSWEGKAKWMVGLIKGAQAPTPLDQKASTGDRLVVYVPRFTSRGKSFWQMKMEDFEEDWRSDPLPGRVLDVRVGDPKNEGKTGILVLTSENKDQEGHLYFYLQDR